MIETGLAARRADETAAGSALEVYARSDWLEMLAESGGFGAELVSVVGDWGATPARLQGRTLRAPTNLYTVQAPPPARDAAGAEALARSLRAAHPRVDRVAWDALSPEDAAACAAGFRAAGWVVETYEHFGCWRTDVSGLGFAEYLTQRPGRLRSTIKRKRARLEKRGSVRFLHWRGPDDALTAMDAYGAAHRDAWQGDEPHPDYPEALIKTGFEGGWGHVFAISVDDVIVAAQIWTAGRARITVLKLAHDRSFGDVSPGTLLTAEAIEHFLADGAHSFKTLDFGRGDDAYKKDWAPDRVPMTGLLAETPLTFKGAIRSAALITRRIVRRFNS